MIYLILLGRISRLTDNKVIRKLSPWGLVEKKEVIVRGRPKTVFSIMGIAMLDYIDLYQKFIPVSQESYKLDYIGKVELGVLVKMKCLMKLLESGTLMTFNHS